MVDSCTLEGEGEVSLEGLVPFSSTSSSLSLSSLPSSKFAPFPLFLFPFSTCFLVSCLTFFVFAGEDVDVLVLLCAFRFGVRFGGAVADLLVTRPFLVEGAGETSDAELLVTRRPDMSR